MVGEGPGRCSPFLPAMSQPERLWMRRKAALRIRRKVGPTVWDRRAALLPSAAAAPEPVEVERAEEEEEPMQVEPVEGQPAPQPLDLPQGPKRRRRR